MSQPMNQPIPFNVQLAIVRQHRASWEQERYSTEVSLRVQRRVGGEAGREAIGKLTARLEDCERALDEIGDIERELDAQPPGTPLIDLHSMQEYLVEPGE